MNLSDFIPFWPDNRTYFVPWVKFKTTDGEKAEGPMIRERLGRREILAWTDRDRAKLASTELIAQTGGSYDIRTLDRKELMAACREFAWGKKLVAVVME